MGKNHIKSAWDDERADEILRAYLPTGVSYGMIAAHINALELGNPISGSAVAGRVKRLGLQGPPRRAPLLPKEERKPDRKTPFRPDPFNSTRYSGPPMAPLPPPKPVLTDAPPEKRVQLVDHRNDGCRFYLGDVGTPDGGFCPETKNEGSSYCSMHAIRCRKTF